jgi:DNA repair exonuclease SbcCD ATPase subunit
MKLREYFLSVKEQLEEYNDVLQGELKKAQEEIEKRDSEIRQLLENNQGALPGGPQPVDDIRAAKVEARWRSLTATKEQLQTKAESLKQKLQKEEEARQLMEKLLSELRT